MTLAFSTSSPWASVAAFASDGAVIWSGIERAPQAASGAIFRLLTQLEVDRGLRPSSFNVFAADIGPGSFTGVRVGVVLAKTFAFLQQGQVVGATAFDLINPTGTAVLPSKRGEYFIRLVGETPFRTTELPGEGLGYGGAMAPETPPDAARFASLLPELTPSDPMTFLPDYLIEPSISLPKKPFAGLSQ